MLRSFLVLGAALYIGSGFALGQADVRVESTILRGPRELQSQTKQAVVRDYLQAWKTVSAAFDGNNVALLDGDFVGTAKDRLVDAIQEQAAAGIHCKYRDKSHTIRIIFYSPEGLSIQLTDDVEYDVQVFERDKVKATQQLRAHYIVVMTPAEVKWKVRVFQAQPD